MSECPVSDASSPPDDENEFQVRQPVEDRRDLPPKVHGSRDEHADPTDRHSLGDRFRAECREERRVDAPGTQRAQGGDVQLGDPPGECRHPGAALDAVAVQTTGEPVDAVFEHRVGDVDGMLGVDVVTGEPAHRDLLAAAVADMACDGEIGDVQVARTGGEPEFTARSVPRIRAHASRLRPRLASGAVDDLACSRRIRRSAAASTRRAGPTASASTEIEVIPI